MLHIILGILKGIFILIGIVLGLIAGMVLIALFVPVRYRVQATKEGGRVQAMAHITFLLHILSLRIMAGSGGSPQIAVRICGIMLPLRGSRRPAGDGRDAAHMDREAKPDGGVGSADDGTKSDGDGIAGGVGRTYSETDGKGEDDATRGDQSGGAQPNRGTGNSAETPGTGPPDTREDPLSVLLQRLHRSAGRLRAILYRLQAAWRRLLTLPERMRQIWMRLCRLAEKPGALLAFLQEYEVNAILRDSLGYLRRLLRHYAPRRLNGWLKFGTGDPALTGELTGVLYLLLPARAEGFSVEPCFTEKLFETELDAAGHIRACHLISLLFRVISDRRVRRLIRVYRERDKH